MGPLIILKLYRIEKAALIDANDHDRIGIVPVQRQVSIDRELPGFRRHAWKRWPEIGKSSQSFASGVNAVERLIAQFRPLSSAPSPDIQEVAPRGVGPAQFQRHGVRTAARASAFKTLKSSMPATPLSSPWRQSRCNASSGRLASV